MSRGTMVGSVRRSLFATLILVLAAIPLAQARPAKASSVLDVGAYQQQYSLSCEYASLQIVTQYWGDAISEHWAVSVTPWHDNPHYGFRGDINGAWGDTWDYGVYAEPLAEIARWAGYGAEVSYGADADILAGYLDAGIPLIVWMSVEYAGGWYEYDEYGQPYKIVPYEHVMVAYGYDDGGVYISDPGTGWYDYFDWDYFLDTWSIMDGMALAVYPV